MKSYSRNSFIVALLAALIGIGFFVYLYISIDGMMTEASYLRGDRTAADTKSSTISGAEKMLVDTAAKRKTLDSYFVPVDGSVDFIDYLESLGKKANTTFSIQNIDVIPGPATDFKDTLSIELRIAGSWQGILQTLALLEEAPYQITLISLNMNRFDTTVGKKTTTGWQATVIMQALKIR